MQSHTEKKLKDKIGKEDKKTSKHQVVSIEELIKVWAKENAKEVECKVSLDLEHKKHATKKSKIPHQELIITPEPIRYGRSPQRLEEESKLAARRHETFVNATETNKKFRLKLNAKVMERRVHTFTFGLNLGIFAGASTPYGGGGVGVGLDFH